MSYKVIISELAESQADDFLAYLMNEKQNAQAVVNLIDDIEATKEALSLVAASRELCRDPELHRLGYRIMPFRHHRYLWIYQVNGDRAEVKAMYHELQDYENTFKAEVVEPEAF